VIAVWPAAVRHQNVYAEAFSLITTHNILDAAVKALPDVHLCRSSATAEFTRQIPKLFTVLTKHTGRCGVEWALRLADQTELFSDGAPLTGIAWKQGTPV
jgi:hypothetical protein